LNQTCGRKFSLDCGLEKSLLSEDPSEKEQRTSQSTENVGNIDYID